MHILRFVLLLIISTSLCSCSLNEKAGIQVSSDRLNMIDLCSQQYSYDELVTIAHYEGDLFQYDATYPIECIRQQGSVFRVVYPGKTHIAIIYFHQDGTKSLGRVFQLSPYLCEFDDALGKTLSDIMKLDPVGDYTFLYTGQNESQVSNHYTLDGYKVVLSYDAETTVTDIHVEAI